MNTPQIDNHLNDNYLNRKIFREDVKIDKINDDAEDQNLDIITIETSSVSQAPKSNDLVELDSTTEENSDKIVVQESNSIPSFPEFSLPPTNDENKTLEILDLWNYDDACTKFKVRYSACYKNFFKGDIPTFKIVLILL